MNFDKFTIKAQEVVQEDVRLDLNVELIIIMQ